MPCITELRSLFYPNGVKIVPHNIYELLTPIALAHLIMGDGSVQRHGLIICTNSYSVQDVIRLMNVLMIRYRLKCNLRLQRQNKKVQYMIYIYQRSMPSLLNIVSPYMHPYMLYKLINSLSNPSNPSNHKKISVFYQDNNETTIHDSISAVARACPASQGLISTTLVLLRILLIINKSHIKVDILSKKST
jgi:hypothetical protein